MGGYLGVGFCGRSMSFCPRVEWLWGVCLATVGTWVADPEDVQ